MAKGLFDLSGKVAVITGGNSGLGLGFARGIAKQGGDVVIWGRSAEKNAAAKKELESSGYGCRRGKWMSHPRMRCLPATRR